MSYGFGEGTDAYEVFHLEKLTEPDEYARFMLLLSERSLLSGRTQQILDESRREDKDITVKLYEDYQTQRHTLIDAVQRADSSVGHCHRPDDTGPGVVYRLRRG